MIIVVLLLMVVLTVVDIAVTCPHWGRGRLKIFYCHYNIVVTCPHWGRVGWRWGGPTRTRRRWTRSRPWTCCISNCKKDILFISILEILVGRLDAGLGRVSVLQTGRRPARRKRLWGNCYRILLISRAADLSIWLPILSNLPTKYKTEPALQKILKILKHSPSILS